MVINRSHYIDLLMHKRWNGKVKIITGIRRCGKSFLLNTLYKQALIDDLLHQAQDYLEANSIPQVNYTLRANLEKIL